MLFLEIETHRVYLKRKKWLDRLCKVQLEQSTTGQKLLKANGHWIHKESTHKRFKLLLNKDFIEMDQPTWINWVTSALAASCLIGPKSNKRQALASDAHSKWLIIQLFIALWLVQVPLPLQKVLFSFHKTTRKQKGVNSFFASFQQYQLHFTAISSLGRV